MKKLILLISLCLLSQNYTIANEIGESQNGGNTPSTQANGAGNVLRVQNSYSSNLIKQKEEIVEENKNINKSNLKFPGLKLPEIEEKNPTNDVEQKSVSVQKEEKVSEIKTQVEEIKEAKEEQAVEQASSLYQADAFSKPVVKEIPKKDSLDKASLKYPGLKLPQVEAETKAEDTKTSVQEKKTDVETQPQQDSSLKNVNNTEAVAQSQAEEKDEEPQQLGAMDILRSHTQTPIHQSTKIKPLPKSVMQKYKLSKNNITIQKGNSDNETQDKPLTITIKKVEFPNSKVFTQEELQSLAAPLLAGPVTIEDIKKVISDITRCYTLGDYPTAKAYLPPQKVVDGVLKIELLEGTIGKINVEGNKWVKTSYFKKRIAYNKEGELLNVDELEKDVVKFNNNNTAKVSISLSAGEKQGESDVTLNVSEQSPFRLAIITDNMGRKTIGTGRFGSMISTDSLLGVSDRFTLGGYLGRGNRLGFTDYSIPVGRYGTRIGASAAAGNISVVNGPMRKFDVGGTTQVYSVYVAQPIFDAQGANISSYTAVNFKKSTSDIFDVKFYDNSTFSLSQGFNARKDTDRGIWYTGHTGSFGFKALSGDQDFFKYEGNITRLHDFGKGIIGQFRVSGQYSPDKDLPWMEQFQIGGMSTVRGYSEALLLGKSGYFASAEIITPLPILPKRIGSDKLGYIYPREMIKGAIFMDNGMIFPYKYGQSIDSGELLMSWGFGLRVNIKDDLSARFYWGYGLHNRYDTDYKMGRFHFDLTCAPDVGRIVAGRTPSSKKKKTEEANKEEDL